MNPRVEDLIQLIGDLKMINKQMENIGYNVKKLPLGQLSKHNLLKAYRVLQDIETNLLKPLSSQNDFVSLSNDFYTLIPYDFGRKRPPIINTEMLLREKLEMVEALVGGVESYETIQSCHELYDSLNCKIYPLEISLEWKVVEDYLFNTHSAKHADYSITVLDIFKVEKFPDVDQKNQEKGTRKLLFHGSRLSNFAGILSKGLRITPPHVPQTGSLLGRGIYFADMMSKSSHYCFTTRENNIGLILLCDICLGKLRY